jgi:cytochrome c-type biogenesis protein CcmF
VAFRVIVAPLTAWVWLGALLAVLGGFVAIWPAGLARRVPVRRAQRAPASVAVKA